MTHLSTTAAQGAHNALVAGSNPAGVTEFLSWSGLPPAPSLLDLAEASAPALFPQADNSHSPTTGHSRRAVPGSSNKESKPSSIVSFSAGQGSASLASQSGGIHPQPASGGAI